MISSRVGRAGQGERMGRDEGRGKGAVGLYSWSWRETATVGRKKVRAGSGVGVGCRAMLQSRVRNQLLRLSERVSYGCLFGRSSWGSEGLLRACYRVYMDADTGMVHLKIDVQEICTDLYFACTLCIVGDITRTEDQPPRETDGPAQAKSWASHSSALTSSSPNISSL